MKYLLFFILVFSLCKASFAQNLIPNNDFENWNQTLDLEKWQTNSCWPCVPAYLAYVVQQDTFPNAYHGKYSIKLVAISSEGAYFTWAYTTFPIAMRPNNLTGYIKCNIRGADTVSIKIKLLNGKTTVDSGIWINTDTIKQWTGITIPISNSGSSFDSASITISTSTISHDSIARNDAIEFWVDDLSLDIVNGIKDLKNSDNLFNSYPNPADKNIYFNTGFTGKYTCTLNNLLGEEIRNYTFSGASSIDVSNIPDGIYILRANFNGQTIQQKQIIIH